MIPVLAAFLLLAVPQVPTETPTAPPLGVEVTHLGNEGFLLRSKEATVLIDAFLEEPYSLYEPLSDARLGRLLEAEGPFAGAVTCLASHKHRDHFQPAVAAAYLRTNPGARFLSSPQVVALLREEDPLVGGGEQVESLYPTEGALSRTIGADLSIRFLALQHSGERWKELQNLGHDFTLGGLRFLHVGDADTRPANFNKYGLADIEFDVALLPYWYFEHGDGQALIAECIRAKTYVACHVPPTERAALRRRSEAAAPGLWIPGPEDEPRLFLPASETPAEGAPSDDRRR